MKKGQIEEQSNLVTIPSHSTSPEEITVSDFEYSVISALSSSVGVSKVDHGKPSVLQAKETTPCIPSVISQVTEPYIQNPISASTLPFYSPLPGCCLYASVFQTPFFWPLPHNPVVTTSPYQPVYNIPTTHVASPPSIQTISDPIPVIRCTCRKTHCLKLYCECLKAGKVCSSSCSCVGCLNQEGNEARKKAINFLKLRNVKAYKRLVSKEVGYFRGENYVQNSTSEVICCSCKRSNCKKKYCSCFLNGRKCSSQCSCFDCQNK